MKASNIGAGSQPSLEKTIADYAEQRHQIYIESGILKTEHTDGAKHQDARDIVVDRES